MNHPNDNFDYAAFDALPEAERQEILRHVLEFAAALGVTVPEEDARQAHCDAVAASLLVDLDI